MRIQDIRSINFRKLSGVTSVIGADISEHRVRLAELKIHGGTVNKLRADFCISHVITHELQGSETVESALEEARSEMKRTGMDSRYAVSTIRGNGVKTVRTTIPADESGIEEWVEDHIEGLLKMPVPRKDLTYRYEIINTGQSGSLVEITFVRNADIERVMRWISLLGVEIIGLSAGVRDGLSPYLLSKEFVGSYNGSYALVSDEDVTEFVLHSGRIVGSETRQFLLPQPSTGPDTKSLFRPGAIVAGIGDFSAVRTFKPFGCESEYALASGLALKGFLPELNRIDFLPIERARIVGEHISKRLLQRTVIASGVVVFALLFLQFIASWYVAGMQNNVEDKMLQSGVNYTELKTLENGNVELRNDIQKIESAGARSNVALFLHEIAKASPEGVWFSNMSVTAAGNREVNVAISGYATDGSNVAEFVTRCERNNRFRDVRLVRSGIAALSEGVPVLRRSNPSPIMFLLSLKSSLR